MKHVIDGLSLATLPAGMALATYAGYGIGLARTSGAGMTHWTIVAALLAAAAGLVAWRVWHAAGRIADRPRSLTDSLAILDTLAPVLLQHADGRDALQDLIEILVESACHATAARHASTEGRTHA